MSEKKKSILFVQIFLVFVMIFVGTGHLAAEESDDNRPTVFSLGDNGEVIQVCGREDAVGDYGEVLGYEVTNYNGDGYVEYRDDVHHSMKVMTSEGETEGYCMQPYVKGPGTDSYVDYSYVEGLASSLIFKELSESETDRLVIGYVMASKYGYGGYKANPNYGGGRNYQDGGTYGTYLIEESGDIKAVDGLMIGGKVYQMTPEEARTLTQVMVHYVGNNNSRYNITDFTGYTNPEETSAAFRHIKSYIDCSQRLYDEYVDRQKVLLMYDDYENHKPHQVIYWSVYDYSKEKWVVYDFDALSVDNIGEDNKVNFRVQYYSDNMCNKLVVNNSNSMVNVKHSYEPFVVGSINYESEYYDYFTVKSNGNIPINVTYDKVCCEKVGVKNELVGGMEYDLDTFSQTAIIEIDASLLIESKYGIELIVQTGEGSVSGLAYDAQSGRYNARIYSSPDIQDCLFLGSNGVISANSCRSASMKGYGSVALRKVSARTDITDNNPCYSMKGAVYGLYEVDSAEDESRDKPVGIFKINDNNVGIVSEAFYNEADIGGKEITCLPEGIYMACELEVPENGSYKLDNKKYYVTIARGDWKDVKIIESKEEPVADPIPFEIVKQCAEGENVGSSTLEGAEFTVWYYKGEYDSVKEIEDMKVKPDRIWRFETAIAESTNNATCIIHEKLLLDGSDEPYLNDKGSMILPLGTIVVAETKAPKGYMLEGATYSLVNTIDGSKQPIEGPYISKVQVNEGTVRLSVANKIIVDEEPVRGDLKLQKKDKTTGEPMANIPFLITSVTTGEKHVIVTDKNGIASTSNAHIKHSDNTNGNDEYDEESVDLAPTGIWFVGNQSDGEVHDDKGALPYDTYIVKELPCKANQGYYLSEEMEISVCEAGMEYDCGTVLNIHTPNIKTEVIDSVDGDKIISVGERVDVIDKVVYEYLESGKTYILEGYIVNKQTTEKISIENEVLKSVVEFTPVADSGQVEVPFSFELSCCKGDKVVVYEYLYDKESGELLASHQDIECEEQTLTVEPKAVRVTGITTPTTEVVPEMVSPETKAPEIQEPKTGDDFKTVPLIVLMLLSGITACGLIIYKYKINKRA